MNDKGKPFGIFGFDRDGTPLTDEDGQHDLERADEYSHSIETVVSG